MIKKQSNGSLERRDWMVLLSWSSESHIGKEVVWIPPFLPLVLLCVLCVRGFLHLVTTKSFKLKEDWFFDEGKNDGTFFFFWDTFQTHTLYSHSVPLTSLSNWVTIMVRIRHRKNKVLDGKFVPKWLGCCLFANSLIALSSLQTTRDQSLTVPQVVSDLKMVCLCMWAYL